MTTAPIHQICIFGKARLNASRTGSCIKYTPYDRSCLSGIFPGRAERPQNIARYGKQIGMTKAPAPSGNATSSNTNAADARKAENGTHELKSCSKTPKPK
jgi:hypothetical protein